MVREPVSHDVSTFFQNCFYERSTTDKKPKIISEWYDFKILIDEKGIQELLNIFMTKKDHYWTVRYFDLEFRDQLGIDFYKEEFNKSKGYKIYKYKNYDILLIKFEKLTDCIAEAIKEFLGIEKFSLREKNITRNKKHGEIYELFKDKLILPDRLINDLYSSKYIKQFYSDEEISFYKKKWTA